MPKTDIDTYKMIRKLYAVDGLSQRKIAKQLGISRKTVKKYCDGSAFPGVRKEYLMEKGPLRVAIEKEIKQIIEDNKDAPSKQKLNAKILWQMMIKAGYAVGESTIRKYIREMRKDDPDIFVPLEFEPGEAMEFDWGDAYAYIANIKTRVSLFCAVLPYSYGIFAAVFPDKTNPSFFTGHVMAFEYFGGVALRCIYDNLKSAVLKGEGVNAIKQENFKKLEAHYAFESVFCNAASGWEKGSVENLVAIVRQIAFVPMPKVENFTELQEHVTQRCVEYCLNHKIKGRPKSIKDMLAEEKTHLLPLPTYPLDPAEEIIAKVYHDLTVRHNGVKYSVPESCIGLSLTLKISPFYVDIYQKGDLVHRHKKALHPGDHQYIPDHYLEILKEKPRAIPNAAPIKKGVLPPELSEFMRLCNHRDRNYQLVNILLLGREIDTDTLLWAVKQANSTGTPSYELVCFYLEIQADDSPAAPSVDDGLKVQTVDFNKYDELIGGRSQPDE